MKKPDSRQQRRRRLRAKISGTSARPRASVFRSLRRVTVQLIDDTTGRTLVAVAGEVGKNKTKQAEMVGAEVAKQAAALGVKQVVFDRSGYRYHGRVKTVADAMRQGGLEF